MNQYAGTQQDDSSGLVNNPRYQGQSGGTVPMGHDGRGPQQETRYGAVPLSTGTTGSQQQQQQQQQSGMVNPNARPSQAGYGNQPPAGHGNETEFANEQPGYGERGFGAPSEGQNTGNLWPKPATPPNAHKTDLEGQGLSSGYGGNQTGNQAGYGGNQTGNQAGYGGNQAGNQGGYGENQAAGYDQPPRHAHGQEFNPNVNHPSEERGFGGGLGAQGYDQSQQLGDGYHNGMATGADAYGQQPRTGGEGYNARTATGNDAYVHGNHPPGMQDRVEGVNEPSLLGGEREGMRERMPQAMLGERRTEPGYDMSKGHHHLPGQAGHHQNLDGTGLGGQRDTGTGLGGQRDTGTGLGGQRDTGTGLGGQRDTGTGLGGQPHTGTGLGGQRDTGTGVGGQPDTGVDATRLDNERRGKEFEDTSGTDSYDGTGTGYDDTTATGTAPPKKGLMTKIKEKLHH